MPRILGIDYGERRMGFAVSDEAQLIALPLCVVAVLGPRQAAEEAVRLVREKQAGAVVVGLPLNLNGTRGPAAEAVAKFVERLRPLIAIPVATWDERLTSKAAERALIAADVRRAKRKTVIDQVAAQIMLQSYLDAQVKAGGQ
jgi:putative Holliday junction resolvase